jgi:hypothetical protein
MNRTIYTTLFSLLIIACGGNTKLTVSYIQEGLQPKKYNKLAIVALTNSDPNRLVLEEALVEQFKQIGVNALSTFNIFPLAGRPDVLAEMELDDETIRNHIRETVKKNNIDALMIISLLDAKQVERYVNTPANSVGFYYPAYPAYGYHYYDYYSYVYGTTRNSGYYTTQSTYFVETNLYDIESEELIWTGQTKTENIISIEAEAPNFARIIVRDIQYKKVLIP